MATQSKPKLPTPTLLVDRKQAAAILNTSPMTIRRIEADGLLEARKLRPGRTSTVMYRRDDVLKLAGIETT